MVFAGTRGTGLPAAELVGAPRRGGRALPRRGAVVDPLRHAPRRRRRRHRCRRRRGRPGAGDDAALTARPGVRDGDLAGGGPGGRLRLAHHPGGCQERSRAPAGVGAEPREPGGGTVTASNVRRQGKLQLPLEDPQQQPARDGARILDAATRLLADRGYEAVTLENVAAEAGVNKASIRYNFGNKAGLIMAVADDLIHDECLRLAADTESVPEEERLHAAMLGIRRMIVERRFLPRLLRHPAARVPGPRAARAAVLPVRVVVPAEPQVARPRGRASRSWTTTCSWVLPSSSPPIPDGLSVQAGLNPDGFDLGRPLAALEFLLRNSMSQLLEIAASRRRRGARPDTELARPDLRAASRALPQPLHLDKRVSHDSLPPRWVISRPGSTSVRRSRHPCARGGER